MALVRRRRALIEGPWLFPGGIAGRPLTDIRHFWGQVRDHVDLPGVRIHDLRYTFASLLASGGMSLPMIGKLLGHSTLRTT